MTLQESLQTGFLSDMLAEAFASTIVANLHKDNPEVMNQFFRSLSKYRYSMQGCKDEFITETTVADALKKNKSDQILKIWMKGNKIGFFSVANTVIDTDFNWRGKNSPGKRDNSKVFGDPEVIEAAFSGTPWSKLGFTKVYMIAFSSLKALGQGQQPTQIVDPKTEEIVDYTPTYVAIPKKGKRPSQIGKTENLSKVVKVEFLGGDIFDTVSGTYTDDVKYADFESNGWIMDKMGNKFPVNGKEYSSDQGRIAGGCWNTRVTIAHTYGVIKLSGYSGAWSRPSSDTYGSLVSDIKAGIYLEDYLAKHIKDIDYDMRELPWIKELVTNGDTNAKTFDAIKTDIEVAKATNFYERYLVLPKLLSFTINGSSVIFNSTYIKQTDRRISKTDVNPDYIDRRIKTCIDGILVSKLNKILQPLLKYDGLCGNITYANTNYGNTFALDTIDKKLVVIENKDTGIPKILGDAKIILGEFIHINGGASDKTKKMWKNLQDVWKKLNPKSKWDQEIESRLHGRPKEKFWLGSKKIKRYTIADCKRIAAQIWNAAIEGYTHSYHDEYWGPMTVSADKFRGLPWKLVKEYIDGTFDVVEEIEAAIQNDSKEPEPVKAIKLEDFTPKQITEAKAKMTAWHNGERKQNIGAMSDDKLRMNWIVCKSLGYDKELAQLENEGKKRGVTLQ